MLRQRVTPPTANQITTELLLRVSQELPGIWLWRNNRFVGKAVGAGGKIRHVSAGIDGQGDLSGMAAPSGRRIEAEIKAGYAMGRDRQSTVQEAFQRRIEDMGGVYILVERVDWNAKGKPDVSIAIEALRRAADV